MMTAQAERVYPAWVRGVFATQAYFVVDKSSHHVLLVDPGASPVVLLGIVEEHSWTVEKIILTHGHFDHWGAAGALRERLGCPVVIHCEGVRFLADPMLNLSARHGRPMTLRADETVSDGDVVALANGSCALKVLHTPGHTDDSCALYDERLGIALVGDTVYDGGPGLTCFPTGDGRLLATSIAGRLSTLPNQTVLLSGHSEPITLQRLLASASGSRMGAPDARCAVAGRRRPV